MIIEFYVVNYPNYNEIFDNCIMSSSYSSFESFNHFVPTLRGHAYECGRIFFFAGRKPIYVDTDFLYYPGWLHCENLNNRKLLSLNDQSLSDWEIARTLLHIFMNPRKEVRTILRLTKTLLFQRSYRIGVQLRMGGQLAATPESYQGIPLKRFPEVAAQITKQINKSGHFFNETLVYVSSDSPQAVNELRKLLNPELLVADFPLFSYGHSDTNVNKRSSHVEVVNRILADFYIVEQCDFVFVSWQSSFGRLMCNMKSKSQCAAVLNIRKVAKY